MNRPEQALSIGVATYLRAALPSNAVFAHVPNGGKRGRFEAWAFKAMGQLKGFPDYLIGWAPARMGFIEMKSEKGDLEPEQKAVHARLEALGLPVAVCRSVDEVEAALIAWGVPLRANVRLMKIGARNATLNRERAA